LDVPGNGLVEGIVFMSEEGENLKYIIGRRVCLCVVSFLEASLLEKLDFWCCLGGVSAAATRN
jgi:hypothetical protein